MRNTRKKLISKTTPALLFNAINSMRNTRKPLPHPVEKSRFNAINSMRNTRIFFVMFAVSVYSFNAINSMRNTRTTSSRSSSASSFNAINSMRNTRNPRQPREPFCSFQRY